MGTQKNKLRFSRKAMQQVEELISHYPEKVAALIPVLHIAQEEFDHISPEVVDLVAELLDTTPSHVYGTANFYDMFRFKKRAKHEVIICRNLSCYLCGSERLKKNLIERLQTEPGQSSTDGRFLLLEAECLAACDKAPVMMVDEKLFEKVDADNLPEDLTRLLEKS